MISTTRASSATTAELQCQLAEHSHIKLIGLGGIGCIVLQFLAMFLGSLHRPLRLVLIDGDRFEHGNAGRMQFHEVGNKAEVKAAETIDSLDVCDISIIAVPEYVTPENVARLIQPGDHVLMCVDNHATRRVVSDHCETLADVILISGGNEGVDPPRERGTYGNVQIAIRRGGEHLTPPLTRFHPEIANPDGKLPTELDCGQLALSTPQILFANLAAASAMLNAFFAYTCDQLTYGEVTFDILAARMLPQLPLKR